MQLVAMRRAVFCVVCSLCVFCSVRLPLCVCVCKYGSDVLFVYCCNVFLGMSVSGVSERADDIQSVFGVCVDFVCVFFDVIECDSKGFGALCDRDRRVV